MRRVDWSVYLVTDRPLCLGRGILDVVAEAVQGGVTTVQLREKECDAREFVELARSLKAFLAPWGIPLIINDRVDVALAAGADGVHVGQSDMAVADVRDLVGDEMLVGLSVETLGQALATEPLPVDYLGVGPIFDTATKPDAAPALGLTNLKKIRRLCSHPLVAIGGINQGNTAETVRAGAHGVAVVSAICSAESPREAAEEIKRAVEEGRE